MSEGGSLASGSADTGTVDSHSGGRAVVSSHNHVPLGSSDSSGGSEDSSGGVVLGSGVSGNHTDVLEGSCNTRSVISLEGLSPEADDGVGGSNSKASTHPFVTTGAGVEDVSTHLEGDLVTIRVGLDGRSNLDDGISGPGGGRGTSEGNVKNLGASSGSSSGTSTHSDSGHIDVERKRKIIGKQFIEVFKAYSKKQENIKFLAQGTLYPDVIESSSNIGKKSAPWDLIMQPITSINATHN